MRSAMGRGGRRRAEKSHIVSKTGWPTTRALSTAGSALRSSKCPSQLPLFTPSRLLPVNRGGPIHVFGVER